METYEKNTAPLLEYYKNSGRLEKIDGTGDVEEIYSQLEKLI